MKTIQIIRRHKRDLHIYVKTFKLFVMCLFPYKAKKKKDNKVIWFGAYGNTNIGDSLIFYSLRRYIPQNIDISLSTREVERKTDFGVKTFLKSNKKEWLSIMKHSDTVILGGGGLFEYYRESYKTAETWILSYLEPLVYARMKRKQYAIIGMGCNNLLIPNKMVRFIFKTVSNNAAFIITRDQKSKKGFELNGVDNVNLHFCLDPVFNYTTIKYNKGNKRNIGFLIWPYHMWPFFHSEVSNDKIREKMSREKIKAHDNFIKELSDAINTLETLGYKCLFPLFHFSDSIIISELGYSPAYRQTSFNNYFNTISECDIIVTMRYHGQITSMLYGKPIVSILVQEKMEALVDNMGILQNMSVDIDGFNSCSLINRIQFVYDNYDSITNELCEKTKAAQSFVNDTYVNSFKKLFE